MAARQIVLSYKGAESAFGFSKLDRSKLYGRRMRQLLDSDGQACSRAALTADGSTLITAGMTAQGYFDAEGCMISTRDLVGLDAQGGTLDAVASTLGVAQDAQVVDPVQVCDTRVHAVYMLEPEDLDPQMHDALKNGQVLAFDFNYRADFKSEKGFVVMNDEGLFALIGRPILFTWSELDTLPPIDADEDTEDDDSLDFGMF
ncbi:MAG: hypothetical protein ACI9VR_002216 [Cognaticolwellia sp.]